jgi:lipoate-protein ligase A
VETLICRLVPWEIADGPTNMATDELLVRTAADLGIASLRFYGWSPATLSLGYFQPARVRLADARLAALPFVRRPSGGATLVHDHEVTYALALPPGAAWQGGGPWMPRIHTIVAAALDALGFHGQIRAADAATVGRHGEVLCFQQFTGGDLLCRGMKVVGSAQRKYRRALLQHGSILLARSLHTPDLPGLAELVGHSVTGEQVREAIVSAFAADTRWTLPPGPLTEAERNNISELVAEKYSTAAWNERR